MSCTRSILAVVGLAVVAGSIALAQPTKEKKPAATPAPAAGQPGEMKLPPGMTKEDMQACMEAGTPGPNHKFLADAAGVWSGKCTMWMTPQADPEKSDCTSTITSIMDGRFTKCETTGEMGGMPFNGFGLYGYDNVAKKFQSTWIDSCGTTMMQGTGELASDGKTLTWTMTGSCPIAKKPITMREVEARTGKDSMTLTMYGPDKAGKEYKVMEIVFTRKGGAANAESTR